MKNSEEQKEGERILNSTKEEMRKRQNIKRAMIQNEFSRMMSDYQELIRLQAVRDSQSSGFVLSIDLDILKLRAKVDEQMKKCYTDLNLILMNIE